nr:hypothetical protein [Aeromicrobium sp.]
AALIATLAYWGDDSTDDWWIDELSRYATPLGPEGVVALLNIKELPGAWLFYAAGVAAVARGRWSLVRRLLGQDTRTVAGTGQVPLSTRLDPTSAPNRSDTHPSDFYPQASALLDSALSVGAATIADAWQTFEILKTADKKLRSPLFGEYYAKYQELSTELDNLRAADEPQHVTHAAWQNAHRALGNLVHLDTANRVHVLVRETADQERFESPVGIQLRDAVKAAGQEHPLIVSGVLPAVDEGAVAVFATSVQFGMLGPKLIRARPQSKNRTGYEAQITAVWLDTGLAPGETGPATV